jgi:hypothetical protein
MTSYPFEINSGMAAALTYPSRYMCVLAFAWDFACTFVQKFKDDFFAFSFRVFLSSLSLSVAHTGTLSLSICLLLFVSFSLSLSFCL